MPLRPRFVSAINPQGPETLPRGFVFEVQRCSDCGLAKTPCFACARGARARAARWFPAIQFCAFRFCFSFSFARVGTHSARRRRGCARGRQALATPRPPCPGHPPRLLINPTQKYLGPKNPEGPRDLLLLCLLKASRTIPFSRRRSLWQR
jgi:hypothetical protein